MQFGAFWDTILRNVTVFALTSSRLDDYSDIVTYTVMITIYIYIYIYIYFFFFAGGVGGGAKAGHFLGGKVLPLKYTR